ncbi:DENN domain-containing protein 3 isoform X1 [Conger conger]|uniref:DENN domain-containing protein 3 isoform X1 n=2 Tax=Conger conger TaxID=82655 RepID=UPI002A5A6FA6|nr:DENN domain-containing protein 3 isoform X1 [Conger conger]XP_061111257.1 DENN domain-containing protein 3 isoform X1 [Conger conger]
MAENLPAGLLEACVVIGADSDKLKQVYQEREFPVVDAEVLQVHAPPFVVKEAAGAAPGPNTISRVQRRRSFIKRKRERHRGPPGEEDDVKNGEGDTNNISVPTDIDLVALPQLCFPGGLQISNDSREDCFHFLVFTDVFGNQTHGVVVQYYRPVQFSKDSTLQQNGDWPSSKSPRLYSPFGICVISKYPYYNALRDCLSCLLVQLRTCRTMDFEEQVKEFASRLALVPIPPPGQLHVAFGLRPLQIVLPSREDKDSPAVDLDLHLPFLCFKPRQLLQIVTCIMTEQRVVFFSSDWALLTLMAECFMLYIRPLLWQHPYVPILSSQMLDFLMAPTAFLMGCHLHNFEAATEMEDLVLINIDDGTVSYSGSDDDNIPEMPLEATECFIKRREGLRVHYDLEVCRLGASTDLNELRSQRRQWQEKLNREIQAIMLELIVNIFREVHDHLNYEHRVFNSEEFLRSREPKDQQFYKQVLDTHIFHSFLKDRLNRKMDSFTRMELTTRSEAQRMKLSNDSPRRPTMQEMARKHSLPEHRMSKRLGPSLPSLGPENLLGPPYTQATLQKLILESGSLKVSRTIKTFKLPEFPPPLAYQYVQNYYAELIGLLGKAIASVPPENSTLLARYYYLRGFMNTVGGKPVDALADFQTLCKTDMDIFPGELVKELANALSQREREQAERQPEIRRLLSKVKKEQDGERGRRDDGVKKFQLPTTHMRLEDFVKRVQESGIVRDIGTINRLFEALTVESFKGCLGGQGADTTMAPSSKSVFYIDSCLDGQLKQVDPEVFRLFYTFWKETEAEAQDVHLPASVIQHLDTNECVYKLSCSIKTSQGVGKIAMTQKRLFLLTEGRLGYVEITKFRDLEEVKISSAPFLLLRIPSLKIKCQLKKEMFEANLKSECDLWNLMVKEMWAGRKMADDHKDPQYMQQALTNVLLMDALVGCLQSQKAIFAASKLAYFDRMKLEVPMMVPKTTSETLKHKINPSLDQISPQGVDVLLYTPGQLSSDPDGDGNPKLWCALNDGKVVVFDAASWSMQQNCIQVGVSQLNCMLGMDLHQVWIGSQDSTIYIINARSMSCHKQLTEHHSEVTDFALEERSDKYSPMQAYSCSIDGMIIIWDVSTLQVKKQFRLTCDRLQSIQLSSGTLWCCARDCVVELRKNGVVHRRVSLPEQLQSKPAGFSGFTFLTEKDQVWTGCADVAELCIWDTRDLSKPYQRIPLADCKGVTCMIRVKNQIWVGCQGLSYGKVRGKIYVVDMERLSVEKELVAHTDSVQALCSAEDRYVLSGSASEDGKIAIWKVE